ncbi:MAG TPA: hypothetical protein VEZ48_05130 [Sphingomonadaceae bacterium]|nr:hypothetical protein [Sphingomonadaceae bacterium]
MSIRKPPAHNRYVCDRCRASGEAGAAPFAAHPVKTLDFTPVPRKHRYDGWTPERQQGFITALAELGSVKHAARAVGMTPEGAYHLRRQPGAESFAAAWDAALDTGVDRLAAATMQRALHGVAVPVFWQGKKIGERRQYNDRLAMFHLRHRLPEVYGELKPPGRGAKSPATKFREGGWDADAAEEEELASERISERMRLRVNRMHANWRAMLFADPAKRAAYELLFGVDGAEDAGHGSGVRFSRFPPELSHALIGVADQEAADRARLEPPED